MLQLDDGKTIEADMLLVATGRVPNGGDQLDAELAGVDVDDSGLVVVDEYQRTSARGVFALGDVSSAYQLKHVANHEMRVVRHNLLLDWDDTDSMRASDHRFVPSAVFTDPQIAMVGMSEAEARDGGYDVVTKIQRYGDTAYGWAMEDEHGIVKLIGDRATGKILGAHVMGHQASSIIQPVIQAMTFGQTAKEVAENSIGFTRHCPRSSRTPCSACDSRSGSGRDVDSRSEVSGSDASSTPTHGPAAHRHHDMNT